MHMSHCFLLEAVRPAPPFLLSPTAVLETSMTRLAFFSSGSISAITLKFLPLLKGSSERFPDKVQGSLFFPVWENFRDYGRFFASEFADPLHNTQSLIPCGPIVEMTIHVSVSLFGLPVDPIGCPVLP